MAKKETKAALLPKRLEGVKIPKAVRESLVKLAKNPVVADLLAAGLVALAAKLRDDPKDKKPKAKGNAEVKDPVLEATTELATAAAVKAVASVRKATGAKPPAARKPAARKTAAKPAAVKAPAKTAAAKPAAAKPAAAKAPATKPPARRAPRKAPAKPKTPPKTGA